MYVAPLLLQTVARMSPDWFAGEAYRALVHRAPTMVSLDGNGVGLLELRGPPGGLRTAAEADPVPAPVPSSPVRVKASASVDP